MASIDCSTNLFASAADSPLTFNKTFEKSSASWLAEFN